MKPSLTPIREYEQAVYVYWLGPGLPTVKIGHTNNPARRLEEFRRETGTPGHKARFAAIVWLDRHRERVEQAAHRTAGEFRRDGEWFALSASDAIDHVVAAAKTNGIRYEVEDCAGVWAETIARREREVADAELVRAEAEYTATKRRRQLEYLAGCSGALCVVIKQGAPQQYDMSDQDSFKKFANYVLGRMARQLNWDEGETFLALDYFVSNIGSFIMAVEENAKRSPVEDTPLRMTAQQDYIVANVAVHTASPFQLALGAVLAGDKAEAHVVARREEVQRADEQIRLAAASRASKDATRKKRDSAICAILLLICGAYLLSFFWRQPDPEAVARHKAFVDACERSGGKYVPNTKYTRGVPECRK